MSTEPIKLLPCPFCGRADRLEARAVLNTNGQLRFVQCVVCMSEGPWGRDGLEWDRWNTRKSAGWVSVNDRLPTHVYSVAVWVVGGPIHFDEDYIDVGIYNAKRGKWQTYGDDAKDMDVEVSHWMEIQPPEGKSFPDDTLTPSQQSGQFIPHAPRK